MKKLLLLILLSGLLPGVSGGCQVANSAQGKPHPDKPNIILILTDDQAAGTIQHMPVLQQELIQKGIEFKNGFLTTPLCCPSRASILTGQYAHNTGIHDNRPPNGGATEFDDTATLATWLKAAGYRTALIGKYLNDYDGIEPGGYVPPGWDVWHAFYLGTQPHRFYLDYDLSENGQIVHYDGNSQNFSADVLTEKAVQFIHESKDEPFFLMVSFFNPHLPYEAAQRDNQLYRDDAAYPVPQPPNYMEEDISDKPAWLQEYGIKSVEELTDIYQRILRSLVSVDRAIGEVIAALDEIGQLRDTVIIYMTDNGMTMGEHRIPRDKNCEYEECIRTPLIISYPALIDVPRQELRMAANIDLAPTFLELAGAPIPASIDGMSLAPILRGEDPPWREALLIEHWRAVEGSGSNIPDFSGIRTEKWKYVELDTGEKELYDLVNDPYELQNLASQPEYSTVIEDLANVLQSLKVE